MTIKQLSITLIIVIGIYCIFFYWTMKNKTEINMCENYKDFKLIDVPVKCIKYFNN